jgi:non-specific serine/threonine protein kinase
VLTPVTRPRRDNLPAEISSFVGREAAIAEIAELLSLQRLVTLRGAPGVGKTRLALRVAGALRDRSTGDEAPARDGVWVVELAALTEPNLVASTVASVLGLRAEDGRPPTEVLCDRLSDERLLLVLDNCEHLSDACAMLADALLRACPDLRILATSREPLGLTGEVVWSVQPLMLPAGPPQSRGAQTRPGARAPVGVETVLASEAGRLFVERARAARPSLVLTEDSAAAVAQICRQLDGIPLAIELAAARVAALTPAEIAARLGDRFAFLGRPGRAPLPRQRTLRESVGWSYDLLSEPERALLRRLSVFRGGFTLDAIEAVCDGGARDEGRGARGEEEVSSPLIPHPSSLDVLASLVEKSLVMAEERAVETRYGFLETIRQYADERLREAGEDDLLVRQHRDWCVELAERAATYLRTPEQAGWRARLEIEHDNLRAALGRTVELGEAEPGLRMCISLWHFWIDRGYGREGYAWLTRLLALESASERTVIRAAGLFVAAKLAFDGGDLTTAQRLGEESLAIAREVGDPHTLHRILTQLGHIARGRGEWLAARHYYEEALPIRRELGEPVDVAVSLACLGHVERTLGEYDTAQALYEESLALALQQGHPAEITAAQHDLGRLAHQRGRDDEAAAWFTQALPVAYQLNHPRRMAYLLEGFAAIAAHQQPERALRLAGAATALRRASGSMLPPSDQAALDDWLAPARQQLGTSRGNAAWEAGAALTAEAAVDLALSPGLGAPAIARSLAPADRPAESPQSVPLDASPESPEHLTAREREVVALVARGLTNRQIAERLVVSERTAEWHVANSLGKLGLSTRAQLAVWAARQELVPGAE